MMKINLVVGTTLLIAMTSVGFLYGLAQVKSEPTVVEVIELDVGVDSTKAYIGDQPSKGNYTADNNIAKYGQPDTSVTELALEALVVQLEAMNNQVLELQAQVQQLTDESELIVSLIAATEQSAQQIEELEQRSINGIFTETYQILNEEEYDADWTIAVSDTLSNLISDHQLSDVMVSDLLCGTTLCKITLKQIQVNPESTNALLESLAWQGFSLKVRDRNTIDGTNDLEVLIGRDGRQFGAIRQS